MEQAATLEQEDKLIAFVGKKAEKYLKKWKTNPNPALHAGMNWAGFFFSFYWLAYRKMWDYAAYAFALFLGVDTLYAFTRIPEVAQVGYWIILLSNAVIGYFGNALYYRRARRHIQEVEAMGLDEEEERKELAKRGGVMPWAIAVLLLFYVVYNLAVKSLTGAI